MGIGSQKAVVMLPVVELRIIGWEIKHFMEKDEEFNIILVDGKPIITDSWVILQVLEGQREFPIEMELKDFEEVVLPKALDPCIRFWRSVQVGHPLFPRREAMLERLLRTKADYPHLSEP